MELRVSVKGQEDLTGFFLPAHLDFRDYCTFSGFFQCRRPRYGCTVVVLFPGVSILLLRPFMNCECMKVCQVPGGQVHTCIATN